MTVLPRPDAVLFDLDGTLLDTAPDMVAALQALLAEESRPAIAYAAGRGWVSNGVNGMLKVGFGELPEPERLRLSERFLAIYSTSLTAGTRIFSGMEAVLTELDTQGIPWGVVTNKAARMTEPILQSFGLRSRCAAVVCGDTLAVRKPRPEPLQHALGLIPAVATHAWYIGDADRDIMAGRAAGMRTVAALYGYIPPGQDPDRWGADHSIAAPSGLLDLLDSADRRKLRG